MKGSLSNNFKKVFFVLLFIVGIVLVIIPVIKISQQSITPKETSLAPSLTPTTTKLPPTPVITTKVEVRIDTHEYLNPSLAPEEVILGQAYLKIPQDIALDEKQTVTLLIDVDLSDAIEPNPDKDYTIIKIFKEPINLYPNLRATLNGKATIVPFLMPDKNIETSRSTSSFLEWRWDINLEEKSEHTLALSIFALEKNKEETIQHEYKDIDISLSQKTYTYIAPVENETPSPIATPTKETEEKSSLILDGTTVGELAGVVVSGILGLASITISFLQYNDQKKEKNQQKSAKQRDTNKAETKNNMVFGKSKDEAEEIQNEKRDAINKTDKDMNT